LKGVPAPKDNAIPKRPPAQCTSTKEAMAEKMPTVSKSPVAKPPIVKVPITKTPPAQATARKEARVEKMPTLSKSPMAKVRPTTTAATTAAMATKAQPSSAGGGSPSRDLSEVDPIYTLIGELGEKKVASPDGAIDEDVLAGYMRRLMRPGMARNIKKDWIEVWAAMSIPTGIPAQAQVVKAILQVGLESEVAETVPDILAELVKGHRAKLKAVEEAIQTLFECGCDEQGCLSRFLLLIFPKSPTSEWGWSRVGWSWQGWWATAERVLSTLDDTAAFDSLRSLLGAIESDSGTCLPKQQIWDEKRLGMVRSALCRYGRLKEDELGNAVDVCLA